MEQQNGFNYIINMKLTYTIARYEQIKSNIFLVAFNIKDDSENSAYVECELMSSEISNKNSQEICELAFQKLKNQIESIKNDFKNKKNLKVGYQFIPENDE